jgi:hypothetical protein
MQSKKLFRGAICASLLALCVCGGFASHAHASVPRTLNGTDIDNDDATTAGGEDSSPVVLAQSGPRITPPVASPEQTWWERIMGWICA